MDNIKKLSIFIILIAIMLFVFGCGNTESTEQQEVMEKVIPVETIEVTKGEFKKFLTLSGITNARDTVMVIPKIAGMEKGCGIECKRG